MKDTKRSALIVASIYPPESGGPATHAKKQFEWLSGAGIKTSVAVLSKYRFFPFGLRHIVFLFILLFKALRYDVIYAHDAWGAGLPAAMVSKFWRRSLIIRI